MPGMPGWGGGLQTRVQSLPNSGFYNGFYSGRSGGGVRTPPPGPTGPGTNVFPSSPTSSGTTPPIAQTNGNTGIVPPTSGYGSNSNGTYSADTYGTSNPTASSFPPTGGGSPISSLFSPFRRGGSTMPQHPQAPNPAAPSQPSTTQFGNMGGQLVQNADGTFSGSAFNPMGALPQAMTDQWKNILGDKWVTLPDGTPDFATMGSTGFYDSLTDDQKRAYVAAHMGNQFQHMGSSGAASMMQNFNSVPAADYLNRTIQAFGAPRRGYDTGPDPAMTWAQNWNGTEADFKAMDDAWKAYLASGGNASTAIQNGSPQILQYLALQQYYENLRRAGQAPPSWYANYQTPSVTYTPNTQPVQASGPGTRYA